MTKVHAAITTSIDGYVAGPNDGPGKGLGEGGERLHYWVFGGPWTYDAEPRGEPTGDDAAWLQDAIARIGAVVGGRWTYEAARHWGDENPWGLPFFIVTHRPEDEPHGGAFTFLSGVKEAIGRAKDPAGARSRSRRRADDRRRAGRARRRQAAVRRVHEVAGPRAPRRAAVAVRD